MGEHTHNFMGKPRMCSRCSLREENLDEANRECLPRYVRDKRRGHRVQIEVTGMDNVMSFYPVPPGQGWKIDPSYALLVIGRGLGRTVIPLQNVRSFRVLTHQPRSEPSPSNPDSLADAPEHDWQRCYPLGVEVGHYRRKNDQPNMVARIDRLESVQGERWVYFSVLDSNDPATGWSEGGALLREMFEEVWSWGISRPQVREMEEESK